MKRKTLFSLICLVMIFTLGQASYAAVEIVPSKDGTGTDSIVNVTVTNSYEMCQNMANVGESLYGASVIPHLSTNKDWGAVSYLSNSIYGTNTKGENTGIEVTIDGVKYYSTTDNITGVMNWGSNPNVSRQVQTSGMNLTTYNNLEEGNIWRDTAIALYNNKDSRFVEAFIQAEWGNSKTSLGMATKEMGAAATPGAVSIRTGLFGITSYWGVSYGQEVYNVTFRPVIWNK